MLSSQRSPAVSSEQRLLAFEVDISLINAKVYGRYNGLNRRIQGMVRLSPCDGAADGFIWYCLDLEAIFGNKDNFSLSLACGTHSSYICKCFLLHFDLC